MPDLEARVLQCFAAVFPGLGEDSLLALRRAEQADWDSVTHVTLVATLEESLEQRLDFDVFIAADRVSAFVDRLRVQLDA